MKRLTLGGEIFWQGRSSDDTEAFAVLNFGGFFKITPDFQLLFTGGHSIAGGRHTIDYLGLYWTGGPGEEKRRMRPNPAFLGPPVLSE